jgi:hypothetical protein
MIDGMMGYDFTLVDAPRASADGTVGRKTSMTGLLVGPKSVGSSTVGIDGASVSTGAAVGASVATT